MKLEFLSHFPLLVFKGLAGFGSPAVDEVCLLKLSLLVGVMELGVRPQRVQEDRGSFAGFVGGIAFSYADGHNFLQTSSVQKVSRILVTILH